MAVSPDLVGRALLARDEATSARRPRLPRDPHQTPWRPSGLLWPPEMALLRLWPVNEKVGNVRNDGPGRMISQSPRWS
jgi:hypothetical protein